MADLYEINCPHCDRPYRLTRQKLQRHAGRSTVCRGCSDAFIIPELPDDDADSVHDDVAVDAPDALPPAAVVPEADVPDAVSPERAVGLTDIAVMPIEPAKTTVEVAAAAGRSVAPESPTVGSAVSPGVVPAARVPFAVSDSSDAGRASRSANTPFNGARTVVPTPSPMPRDDTQESRGRPWRGSNGTPTVEGSDDVEEGEIAAPGSVRSATGHKPARPPATGEEEDAPFVDVEVEPPAPLEVSGVVAYPAASGRVSAPPAQAPPPDVATPVSKAPAVPPSPVEPPETPGPSEDGTEESAGVPSISDEAAEVSVDVPPVTTPEDTPVTTSEDTCEGTPEATPAGTGTIAADAEVLRRVVEAATRSADAATRSADAATRSADAVADLVRKGSPSPTASVLLASGSGVGGPRRVGVPPEPSPPLNVTLPADVLDLLRQAVRGQAQLRRRLTLLTLLTVVALLPLVLGMLWAAVWAFAPAEVRQRLLPAGNVHVSSRDTPHASESPARSAGGVTP